MKLIQLGKKQYWFPESWNELSSRQLVAISHELARYLTRPYQSQVNLFHILTGLSGWKFFWLPTGDIQEKLYLLDWIGGDNTLTKNLLPKYRGLYGPADDFNNLLQVEYIFADNAFRQFKDVEEGQARDINHLNELVAVLYRPGKKGYDHRTDPDGDHREPFNENLIKLRVKAIARWPIEVRFAILHWYEGCARNLVNSYPECFGGSGGGEAPTFGHWSIMRSVAEKAIHGSMEKVEKMFLKTYMMELTELIQESKKLEQMSKRK